MTAKIPVRSSKSITKDSTHIALMVDSISQEEINPFDPEKIKNTRKRENQENGHVVGRQHRRKNNQIEQRKQRGQGGACQKILYAMMIVHALQDIACFSAIEITGWQLHELDQKVSQDRNVDPAADMIEYPAANKVDRKSTCKQGQLGKQHDVNKVNISCTYTYIYNTLSKKWGN